MIQSGWVGRQNGRKLWSRSRGLYLQNWNTDLLFFSVFFFGIRYFSVFGILTSVSLSVFWNTSVFGIGIGYRPRTSPRTTGNYFFYCCYCRNLLLTLIFRSRCLLSILCVYQMAVMAAPRKFSDKIALLTQKQMEGTAAFDAILREVSDTTRVTLL